MSNSVLVWRHSEEEEECGWYIGAVRLGTQYRATEQRLADIAAKLGLSFDVIDRTGVPKLGKDRPPEHWQIPGRCNALARSHWGYCQQYPVHGRTRCAQHGAQLPAGPDHYAYKTGRYSRHLAGNLLDNYEQALADPELLSLSSEIALLDARVSELLSEAGSDSWRGAQDALASLRAAMRSGDAGKAGEYLERLDAVIDGGTRAAGAWEEILAAIDNRRKLVDTQRKLLEARGHLVDIDKVLAIIGGVLDIVRQNVSDRRERARVGREISKLAAGGKYDRGGVNED